QQPVNAASREVLRLLGRQLGEVIREQHGQTAFDRVEGLRRHVVAEHRLGRSAVSLIRRLSHLPIRDLVLLIRAFSIFSQLANIADDYIIRCEAASADLGPLERLKERADMSAERVYEYLAGTLICPVITAHPTEVRRQSIIDREHAIADLLQVGSWVGVDRVGSPFVSASSLDYAVQRFSAIAFDHYLEQLHLLGRELSLSDEFVPVSKSLIALSAKGPAPSPQKADELYRRA